MKTILKFKDEILTNEFGLEFDINLGKDFENNDWRRNENYAHLKLNETCLNEISKLSLENPIKDLICIFVYCLNGECDEGLYPTNKEELDIFVECYNELLKVFTKEQINIGVYSNNLKHANGNLVYITLEELISRISFEL